MLHISFRRAGFTLLELLVTISIIGILIALGTVSFSTAQKRGRDSRRQSDMQGLKNALEQYYAVNTAYPAACTAINLTAVLPNGLPTDPKPGQSYAYICSTTAYCVCATMETDDSGNSTAADCTNDGSSQKNYFCQQSLQ